jgi:hypothetical protein
LIDYSAAGGSNASKNAFSICLNFFSSFAASISSADSTGASLLAASALACANFAAA